MAVITVEELKSRFQRGNYPSQNSYWDLIYTLSGGGGGGTASITASDLAPADPDPSMLWYNTLEAKTYIYYDNFWVELVPSTQGPKGDPGEPGIQGLTGPAGSDGDTGPAGEPGTYTILDTAPLNPTAGMLWFNSTDGLTYLYYQNTWIQSYPNIAGPAGPEGPTGPQGPAGVVTNYIHPFFTI